MANIAIIPARGGSKRLPGKNIRILGGKPLIAWTIEAALASECFDQVIVSTDDEEIANIAKANGAMVPYLRPAEISGDNATSNDVIAHIVNWLEADSSQYIETVTLLQPTSPFRNSSHIKDSFNLFRALNADGVVSVGECDVRLELCNSLPDDHSMQGFLQENVRRTQDMDKMYEINGAIYLFKRSAVGNLAALYSDKLRTFAYVMDALVSVDIDTEQDFLWAEFLLINNKCLTN